MSRRRLIVAGAPVAVVLIVAGFLMWPRGTSEVSPEEALDDFRSRTSDTAPDTPETSSASPQPGVYTYRMAGSEDVKLGPLPSEHRPYPDTVTAVVVAGDSPGCFTMTLNLLDQHTEDTTYCTDDDGSFLLAGHTKHQQIGALSPQGDMTCDPAVIIHPSQPTSELRCTLRLDGGPAAVTAMLTGTTTTQPATITIDGVEHDATQVTIDYTISGGLTGTWTETMWLASDTRLPLRIERDLNIEGLATLTESSELELTDMTPAQ